MLGSLRARHILTVAGLAALSLLAWIVALTAVRSMNLEAASVLPRVIRVLEAMERIADAARMLDGMARELVHSNDAEAIREVDRLDAEFRQSLRLARYEIPRPFTPNEALHARRLLERHERYIADLRRLAAQTMVQQARIAYYEDRLRPLFDLIAADAEQLKKLARQRMDLFLDASRDLSQRSVQRMLVILLLAVAVTGLSIYFFDRSVLQPVRRLRKLALAIKDGHLDARVELPPDGGKPDEISQLAQAMNAMIEARARTERELARTAEALAASDTLTRSVIKSASDCVAALDPDYRIVLQNEAYAAQFAAHFGVAPEPGQSLLDLLDAYPEDRARAAALWGRALAGESYHVTQEISGKNAVPTYYDIRFDVLRDARGHIAGALHTARDVTEQTRMELALRDSAAELDRRVRERTAELAGLMESIPAVVWIARDPDCHVVTGNRAAHDFLGIPPGLNLSLTPGDGRPPSHFKVHAAGRPVPESELPMQRAGREGILIRGVEVEMRFDDGRIRHLFGNASPLCNDSGEVTGVIGAFVDITDRKTLERDLRRAKDAAENASRAKSRFLADVSHEIRTPMNAIIGMADVLLRTPLAPEQGECARTMRQAAGHLLDLLNDILDLSKIEADKLRPQNGVFRLDELLGTVIKTFSLGAREKGVFLDLHMNAEVPQALYGDGRRLRQILINLVSNAVKFTERGGITVRVKRLGPAERRNPAGIMLAFVVEDTGIGIAPDKLPHVFDDFTQAHDAKAEKYGGTGLGLAISRHLARMLDGDIVVVSRKGHGSIFTATARFQPVPAAAAADGDAVRSGPAPVRLHAAKILLVEDNPVNVKVAQLHLEKMGHALTVAGNGPEALDILSRERVDVVLMDLELPGIDGIEVARRIRAAEVGEGRPAIPIVAMTAYAPEEVRERCLEAGMNDFMPKPVNFFALEALVDRLLSRVQILPGNGSPLFDRDAAKKCMGIDEATMAPIFQTALEEFGESLVKLRESAAAGDMKDTRMLAHTLKSISGTLGFSRGTAILEDISAAIKADDAPTVRERTTELARLFGLGLLESGRA